MVLNRSINAWCDEFPIMKELMELQEVFWLNPKLQEGIQIPLDEILDASERLERFSSYIQSVFPETKESKGIIESPIVKIDKMKQALDGEIKGSLYLKRDDQLPISGSIKARGGIYEVLAFAEKIALESGMLSIDDDYSKLAKPEFIDLFSNYSMAVGSTGNLGLSIGIMAAKLGFQATVHMSADARQWKKDMLRSKGVVVVEYEDDYSKAITEGRKEAKKDPMCHFVDDENSKTLFLGYAVVALRLQKQLEEAQVLVDKEHPLYVYLPCGVGGGPGGVAYGLKAVFGDFVHCFFAEPTHSPCMLLGLATGYHDEICVQDFGIDNKTAADGLAVGRASSFVGKTVETLLSGAFTITDERMYRDLATLVDCEGIYLEPSALAGMKGPLLVDANERATHLVWATGGSMVPKDVMEKYYRQGKTCSFYSPNDRNSGINNEAEAINVSASESGCTI